MDLSLLPLVTLTAAAIPRIEGGKEERELESLVSAKFSKGFT